MSSRAFASPSSKTIVGMYAEKISSDGPEIRMSDQVAYYISHRADQLVRTRCCSPSINTSNSPIVTRLRISAPPLGRRSLIRCKNGVHSSPCQIRHEVSRVSGVRPAKDSNSLANRRDAWQPNGPFRFRRKPDLLGYLGSGRTTAATWHLA